MIRNMMWLYCWCLFCAGHIVSYFVEKCGFLYPVYNWLMTKSCAISDKYNFKIWLTYIENEN